MVFRPLIRRLPLHADESVAGFVQRHGEANVAGRLRDVLNLVAAEAKHPIADLQSIARSPAALRAVERLTGTPEGALQSRWLRPLLTADGILLQQGHIEWPEDARSGPRQAVCPACLADSAYVREAWEFTQAPVCVIHECALVDQCPECDAPLRLSRVSLGRCGECGSCLSEHRCVSVSDDAVRAARFVQAPVVMAMGRLDATSPVDAHDVSALLRLCTLPRLGESATYGLAEKLHAVPLERRIEALERLGAVIGGAASTVRVFAGFCCSAGPMPRFYPRRSTPASCVMRAAPSAWPAT